MTAEGFDTFKIAVQFDGERTMVVLSGNVDVVTSQMVSSVMVGLVDQGNIDIVLDLGALDAIDSSGLQAIADLSARLSAERGNLTVRAPADVRRALGPTGLSADAMFELATRHVTSLGGEQPPDDQSLHTDDPPIATTLDAAVGSQLTHESVDAALHRVTVLAAAIVSGAHGVSVTVERAGHLMTAASSDATILRMDQHQYETGEGPCLAAALDGHWFHIESLQQENRWPAFVPRAIEEGIASILSTPIKIVDRSVGALNIYSWTDRVFGTREQELATLIATHASGVLADMGTDEETDARTRVALQSRAAIALAQGIIMERSQLTASEALATLLRSARSTTVTVAEYADQIIASAGDVASGDS